MTLFETCLLFNLLSMSTPAESLSEGEMEIHDPSEIDQARVKLGMHSLSFPVVLIRPQRLTAFFFVTPSRLVETWYLRTGGPP